MIHTENNQLPLRAQMIELGRRAKEASRTLSRLTTEEKNLCLNAMADALCAGTKEILDANALDVENAEKAGLSFAMLDRLRLTEDRVASMVQGIRNVAALPDPVGRQLDLRVRPNGLELHKVACPIGVIVMIYESRPNVTSDAAALCFKSGNATILRGGKEALRSNQAIADLMVKAAKIACPAFHLEAIQVVPTTDRQAIPELLSLTQSVDLCIPRGGEGLIRTVMECSRVPVLKHYKGVCHIYVQGEADLSMAEQIIVNAKTQRPSACNAAETLLVDEEIALTALPRFAITLIGKGVKLCCDDTSLAILKNVLAPEMVKKSVTSIDENQWSREYLDLTISVGVVKNITEAIAHINRYGSAHTECIITPSEEAAVQFQKEVDAAVICWNASTRFNDGGEFGMGAEIGISTDKVGPRGPMGLEELTTYKWLVNGRGQVRC